MGALQDHGLEALVSQQVHEVDRSRRHASGPDPVVRQMPGQRRRERWIRLQPTPLDPESEQRPHARGVSGQADRGRITLQGRPLVTTQHRGGRRSDQSHGLAPGRDGHVRPEPRRSSLAPRPDESSPSLFGGDFRIVLHT